jgi:hypothetical protein
MSTAPTAHTPKKKSTSRASAPARERSSHTPKKNHFAPATTLEVPGSAPALFAIFVAISITWDVRG